MIWNLIDLMRLANTTAVFRNGKWVPVRPEPGGWSLRYRITCRITSAWAVLIGRAEAFSWPEGQ